MRKLVAAKDIREYFTRLFELMESFDGQTTEPDIIDRFSGEILVWEARVQYTNNYAFIDLVSKNDLCPLDEILREKMWKQAQLCKTLLIKHGDHTYVCNSYSGEVRNTIVTLGLCIRLVDKKIQL